MTKSNSDAVLAEQLGQVSSKQPKQHVTLAEARAEAEGKIVAGDTKPTDGKKAKADTGTGDGAKAPRPKIAPGSTPSMVLAAHISDPTMLYDHSRLVKGDAADAATAAATAGIIDKLAKKVGEKAVNLLRHRANPSNVQVYTRIGLDALIADGELTSKGLVATYAKKYKDGTCRAQANQIMNLFPALKIADRAEKGALTLNKDSVIVKAYIAAKG